MLHSRSLHPAGQDWTKQLILYQEPGHARSRRTPDPGYSAAIHTSATTNSLPLDVVIWMEGLIRLDTRFPGSAGTFWHTKFSGCVDVTTRDCYVCASIVAMSGSYDNGYAVIVRR
jgi:hypothetical protein